MKSVHVVALELVCDDVQSAYDYFEERLCGGGARFLAEYFAATDRIALNPEILPLKFGETNFRLEEVAFRAFEIGIRAGAILRRVVGVRGRLNFVIASIWWTEDRVIHEAPGTHGCLSPVRVAVGGRELCE